MTNFAFMLKTYSKDIKYVTKLVESFNNFNVSGIVLYIVVPHSDIEFFSEFRSKTVEIIAENTIPVAYFEQPVAGISTGYLNQQIVKLAFWKLGLCENYLCLDSECVFIRNFSIDDFLTPLGLPYTVLIEDRDRQCDPEYYNVHLEDRATSLLKIQEFLGFDKRLILQTCHGLQIFSRHILNKMESELLLINELTYMDLLVISPYEFSWYNYFLQKTDVKIYPREPFFKSYHSPKDLVRDQLLDVKVEDLARGYLGLIINSNLSKDRETPLNYESSVLKVLLGRFVPLPTLLASFLLGLKRIPVIMGQRFFRKAC